MTFTSEEQNTVADLNVNKETFFLHSFFIYSKGRKACQK